ncbi:MAG: hypothetical protein QG668_320 [Patescibacteria group bacterium]|nr:hypothetical protein [Patescibacteria group bacterium]
MSQKIAIIGSGIGGLGLACLLAHDGHEVHLYEKNEQLGGRLSVFEAEGFRFDMGPSWYLMPDIFEHFFALLGERVEDYLDLRKLSPSYRIFFQGTAKPEDFFSDVTRDRATFERLEPGSSQALDRYLARAKTSYDIAKQWFMYKNYDSITDFFNRRTMIEGTKLSVFSNMHSYVRRYFSTDRLQKVMEYQLVFLGSSPYNTPALYSLMNHIDFAMGVFYPMGGMGKIVEALGHIAAKHGVQVHLNTAVDQILVENGKATSFASDGGKATSFASDGGKAVGVWLQTGEKVYVDRVVSNADIAFTEQMLLPQDVREHSDAYWNSRVMAPSAFLLYLGVRGRIPELTHHNLFFSEDWKRNFAEIFDDPRWPSEPSLYVCAPSVTDPSVAPADCENICFLVPMAAGMEYTQGDLDWYKEKVLRLVRESFGIPDFEDRIIYARTFCAKDFAERYNSFKGTALGFAHTLMQTAVLRPNNISKKVRDLYYVGAGTNPGIGVPICLISAELAYKRMEGIDDPEPLASLKGRG